MVASKFYRSAMQLALNLAEDRVGARRPSMSDEFRSLEFGASCACDAL
jgi:hypothetical protein